MKLRELTIINFRGIKQLNWESIQTMVCLIGPGDSTKTTILDAIELVLSPRWNITINDTDFYKAIVTEPINISAVITDLPQKILREDKFGLHLCFWNNTQGLHDEFIDGDESAIRIRFSVDESLEPEWNVISGETEEITRINSADRELFGVSQIGNYIDRDFSWGRGSALSKLTGRDNFEKIPSILANVSREARLALKNANLQILQEPVDQTRKSATELGVNFKVDLHPGMDPIVSSVGQGSITLIDGEVPIRLAGDGSRRLLAMAIHRRSTSSGALLLVDEIEHGLEPFRIRNLIRSIRPEAKSLNQTIVTTHSSVAIVEFRATELSVVRSLDGCTTITPLNDGLQDIVRGIPEAFLARRIIVCEGKTEYGVCRALAMYWEKLGGERLANLGIEPVCSPGGGGTEAPKYALKLAELGYDVAYFGDSDKPLKPSAAELEENKIKVIVWADNLEIERRVVRDLPWDALNDLVKLAIQLNESEKPEDSIWNAIEAWLKLRTGAFARDVSVIKENLSEEIIREAIGLAAKHNSWFKRTDKGEALGVFVSSHLVTITESDTALKLKQLKDWCYA